MLVIKRCNLVEMSAAKKNNICNINHVATPLRPFIKWAGGKAQLLPVIRTSYPAELGIKIKKYAEPFVGGGAVLFDVLSKYDLEAVYISDTNFRLINTYLTIRDRIEPLIRLLSRYESEFIPLEKTERKKYYYAKREHFNEIIVYNSKSTQIESAALFIFLNKTCFNGLYRVNNKGLFNVPIGDYKNPAICDTDNLLNVSTALKNIEILCDDYRKSSDFIDNNTFVYIDPPYRPLNSTSAFTSYTESGFDDKDQIELSEYVNLLTKRGAKVILSNSDPKNEDLEDEFFDELYSSFKIKRITASRMINSNSKGRGRINELLISNF